VRPFSRRSADSKVVGDRAEAVVLSYLRATLPEGQAETVRWVAAAGEKPGWDLEYAGPDGGLIAVEVKGTTGSSFVTFELTRNEWSAAERLGQRYRLALVARCMGAEPVVEFVDDVASMARKGTIRVEPASYSVSFVPLALQPLKMPGDGS
jgi:hypothetical protein